MIERLAMRAAEFVGSTLTRAANATTEVLPVETSRSRHRLWTVVAPAVGVAAAAVAVAGRRIGELGDDSAPDRAEKTRDELYELARKAGIPGRSSMTKDELAKALAR